MKDPGLMPLCVSVEFVCSSYHFVGFLQKVSHQGIGPHSTSQSVSLLYVNIFACVTVFIIYFCVLCQ